MRLYTVIATRRREMVKAKVLISGGSQSIQLPEGFRVDVDEVVLEKTPQGFLVIPRDPWELFHEEL